MTFRSERPAATTVPEPSGKQPLTRRRPWFVLACLLAAGAVLVAVLYLGGSLRASSGHGHTAGSGSIGVALAADLALLAAVLTSTLALGWLSVAAVVLDTSGGPLGPVQRRCLRPAAGFALAWAAASGTSLVLTVADGLGGSIRDALQPSVVSSYVGQVDQGRALLYATLLALAIAALTPGTRNSSGATGLLALAGHALVLPAMGGHAGVQHTRGQTALAVTTIALHVAAMSIWIGGLVALVVLSRRDREVVVQSLPRFSGLALLCFVAVGSSGVVGALTRVRTGEGLWDTSYGRVILLKAVLFVLLGVFGLVQRRRVLARPAGSDPLPGSRTSAEFRRLARAELALMLVTVAVGVGLSRTPPPVG